MKSFKFIIFWFVRFTAEIPMSFQEDSCGCSTNRKDNFLKYNELHLPPFYDDFIKSRQCTDADNISPSKNNTDASYEDMVLVEGGRYRIGTDKQIFKIDKEGPARFVNLKPFYIDKFEVSNYKFREFALNTHYESEAEKFGNSFVFELFLNESTKASLKDFRVASAPWWYQVQGATWKTPQGPDSDIMDKMNHPVVHVSWNDAQAYCKWAHKRLPTENEWEAACRSKNPYRIYPWGDKLMLDGKYWTNIWQGKFPSKNTALDGYIGTNPVDEFVQNDLGLCNMAGNVWEWTQDYWSNSKSKEMVKKGGSYLCHKTYCFRYRCAARSQNTQDSSAHNLGFRCVKDVQS